MQSLLPPGRMPRTRSVRLWGVLGLETRTPPPPAGDGLWGQGGGRKGLPRSFLNRFARVYVEPFTDAAGACGEPLPPLRGMEGGAGWAASQGLSFGHAHFRPPKVDGLIWFS